MRDGYTGVRQRRSPTLATFLSFLWPGLGQWYAGSGRSAVIFALPVAAVVAVVVVQVLSGPTSLVVSLFDPSTALTILVLIGLLGLWRLISMGDALTSAERDRTWRRPKPLATFAGLALVVIVLHAAAANLAWSFYDAGSHIFVAQEGPDLTVQPSASSPTAGYVATPAVTPETRESRITFLLTGIDSSETRDHALTDTLLVVSVDPTTGKVAMVSFPRDIARFPLSDGRTFIGKINGLMTYANNHKKEFPDGGLPTLVKELGFPDRRADPLLRGGGPRGLLEDDRSRRRGHHRQPPSHQRSGVRRLDRRARRVPPDQGQAQARWPDRPRLCPLAQGHRRQRLLARPAPATAAHRASRRS